MTKPINGMDISISIFHNQPITEDIGRQILTELPPIIGLVIYGDAIIHSFPNSECPTEYGISGLQMQTCSHIGFHWWPLSGFTHVTISSCKPVNMLRCMSFLSDLLNPERMDVKVSEW